MDVLIRDHHQGYIGWDAFERNQRLIKDNANGKSFASRGRRAAGRSLARRLIPLRPLAVGSCMSPTAERRAMSRAITRRGASINHGTERCIGFGGLRA